VGGVVVMVQSICRFLLFAGVLETQPFEKVRDECSLFFQVSPPSPSTDVSSAPYVQLIQSVCSLRYYDFNCNFKV
jgi:hypothetical protein